MTKKIKKNWLAILGLVSISAASVVGTCTSLYFGYKNYEQGPDFDKSYNFKYEINTAKTDNPWEAEAPQSIEDAIAGAKETAESFAKYLNLRDRNDYSVYSETFDENGKFRSFINIVAPNEKVDSKLDKDKKVDKTVGEIYYEYNSNPQISILYSDSQDSYFDFTQEFLAGQTNNNISLGGDATKQINIRMQEHSYEKLVEKFTPVKKDSTNEETYQPFMYVFSDQVGLQNRMAYIMSLSKTDSAYDALSESEKTFWADTVDKAVSAQDLKVRDSIEAFDDTKSSGKNLKYASLLVPGTTVESSFIEEVTVDAGIVQHSGKIKYDFMNKYVLGIVKIENYDDTRTNIDSFEHFFPAKNPTDAKKESNHRWMVIPEKSTGNPFSKFEAELFYQGITKSRLTYPMLVRTVDQVKAEVNDKESIFVVNPTFNGNIFGQSSIQGVLISICAIILILGVIVSVIYRIPGLIAFFLVLLAMSLTFLTICMSGFLISAALIYGLFIGFVVGLLTVIAGFERVKREMSVGYTTLASIKNAFFKSFLPIVDICLVSLLCGVGFVYVGPTQFLSLGVLLILMGLMNLVIIFGGQFLSLFLLYLKDDVGSEKNNLFVTAEKIVANAGPRSLTTFETTFIQKKAKTPFNIFNRNISIVLGSLLFTFIIVGLAIIFTIGDTNSFVFSGGTRIMILDSFITAKGWDISMFMSMIGGKWVNEGLNGDTYWIITSPTVMSFADVAAKVAGLIPGSANVFVQSAIPNSFTVLTNSTINMIFASAGILAAYSLIRFNWLSVIPTFLALILVPGIVVLIFSACQIYIDETIIIAIGIVFAINALLVFNLMANINNSSVKKEKGDMKQLAQIYNIEVWGSKFIVLVTTAFVLCSIVLIGLLISSTILSLMSIILTGVVLSVLACLFFVPQLLILFKSLNNKYLRKVVRLENRQESYDAIDEQLIDGINYEKEKA